MVEGHSVMFPCLFSIENEHPTEQQPLFSVYAFLVFIILIIKSKTFIFFSSGNSFDLFAPIKLHDQCFQHKA